MLDIIFEDFPTVIINNSPTKWINGTISFTNEFPVKLKKILLYKLGDNYYCHIKILGEQYILDKNDIEIDLFDSELIKNKKWEFQIQIVPKLPSNTFLDFNVEIVF